MAINIQSLFSDIIETPAQRQQRQMAEGVMQGRELTRGITSPLVPTALASAIAMRQPQAQDRLRRSVGGMLGIDTRSDSERVQEILSGVNPSDEKSLIQAADLVGQMGMGAQAAQMRQMAADVVRQREADKRAQMNFAMDQALGAEGLTASVESREQARNKAETDAELLDETRTNIQQMRQGMMRQVENSSLSAEEQASLNLQIQGGAFDNKPTDLRDIITNKPLRYGGRALQFKDGEWKDVPANEAQAQGSVDKAVSLLNAARIQYGVDSPALKVIEQNIASGNITKASEFDDYAPQPDAAGEFRVPVGVQSVLTKSSEEADSARFANNRIETATQIIEQNNLLSDSRAGAVSRLSESLKSAAGMRDFESFARTAFTRERNTKISQTLPPGAASDRDIDLYAQGFPPDGASMQEIYDFLKSAEEVNNAQQDMELLLSQFLHEQKQSGEYSTANTIGYAQRKQSYGNAMRELRRTERLLNDSLQRGEIEAEEAQRRLSEEINGFSQNFGFVPSRFN